jgi:hypothetical protein
MTAALMTTIDDNTLQKQTEDRDNRKVFVVSIETHIPFNLSGYVLANSAEEAQGIFHERMDDDGFGKLLLPPKRMESFEEVEFDLGYSDSDVDWRAVSAEPYDADNSARTEDEVKAGMIAVEVADAKAKAEIERKAEAKKAAKKAARSKAKAAKQATPTASA